MLKKLNLLPVIFYAELNNFSGLQSCNLLYLYVAQISCLTLAQRVLTACRDSTCWRKMPCLDLFFIVIITPYPYQIALLVQDTTQEQLHNHSVCSTVVIHQVKPTVTYRLHQHHSLVQQNILLMSLNLAQQNLSTA